MIGLVVRLYTFLLIDIPLKLMWLFVNYIDLCDAALVTFFFWLMMTREFGWENESAVVLGLVVALIIYIIFKHRIGFWIVTPMFCYLWTIVVVKWCCMEWWFQGMSQNTFRIVSVLFFVFSLWLHYTARYRLSAESCSVQTTTQAQPSPKIEEYWYDPRVQEMRPINTKPMEAYSQDWWGYKKSMLEKFRKPE